MKRIINFLLLLFVSIPLFSQECWQTINTITTDWTKPNSNNTWNWTDSTAIMYLTTSAVINDSVQPLTIKLPMWSPTSSTLQNANFTYFQSQPAALKDHHPKDGWELLVKDFGGPFPANAATNTPFYAIYNRYTGKMRVFLMLLEKDPSYSKTGAYISLDFPSTTRHTAALQHLIPLAHPIRTFDNDAALKVANAFDNRDFFWMYAEFPITYDPCTCTDPQSSLLEIKFSLMEEENIDATIDGLVQTTTKVIENNKPADKERADGMQGISEYDPIKAGIKGYESYKSWASYEKTANKVLDNADKFVIGQIDKDLKEKYGSWVYFPKEADSTKKDSIKAVVAELKKSTKGLQILHGQNYDDHVDEVKTLKSLVSAVPYIGAVMGFVDFFSSQTNSKTGGSNPEHTPFLKQTQLKLNGTIKKESSILTAFFNTPGASTTAVNAVPIYNNILGVVNMLEQPELEYAEYLPYWWDQNNSQWVDARNKFASNYIGNIRQYRLKSPIKYVLNPMANLTVESVDVAFVMQYDDTLVLFDDANLMYDVDQVPVEFGVRPSTYPNFGDSILPRLVAQGYEIEHASQNYFDTSGTAKGIVRIRTPYTPITCAEGMTFSLFDHSDFEDPSATTACCRNRSPKLYAKFIFLLSKNDDPDGELVEYVMSFDISDAKKNASKANQEGLGYKVSAFNDGGLIETWADGYIGNPYFPTIQHVPDHVVLNSGDTVTKNVYAKKTITVQDNVTVLGNVTMWAGESIDVSYHNEFNPTTLLNIGKFFGCSGSPQNYTPSSAEILAVCGSNDYRQRFFEKKKPEDSLNSIADTWDFTLFPNPGKNEVYIRYTIPEDELATLTLRTLTGHIVGTQILPGGSREVRVGLDNVSKGVLLATFDSNNKTKTKKLILID
jgi:hypothetical protein